MIVTATGRSVRLPPIPRLSPQRRPVSLRCGFIPFGALLAMGLVLFAPAAAAEDRTSPDRASAFVQQLGGSATTLVATYPADSNKLQLAYEDLVRRSFDQESIGRFALGGTWQLVTAAQQRAYQELFAVWMTYSYARRLGANAGDSFAITGTQPIAERDILVESRIDRPRRNPVTVGWRVREIGGHMKIIDVVVEGVSLDVTQRDEFAAVTQNKGFEGLIGELKARIGDLHATAARP